MKKKYAPKNTWQVAFEDGFDASKFTLTSKDGSLFPYSDVKEDDVIFSENRLLIFNDLIDNAITLADQGKMMGNISDRSSEDWYTKYFFIDTLICELIRDERIDTRYKILYDLTGSKGHIPLQLSLGYQFKKIICLELDQSGLNMGRCIIQSTCEINSSKGREFSLLTSPNEWEIQLCSFLEADWIDCNVGIFDCTVFGECDEGLLCKALESRVRMLQPGSYILIFTKWLIGEPLTWNVRLLTTDQRSLLDGTELKAWLYKTTRKSTDHRTKYIYDEDL